MRAERSPALPSPWFDTCGIKPVPLPKAEGEEESLHARLNVGSLKSLLHAARLFRSRKIVWNRNRHFTGGGPLATAGDNGLEANAFH